MLWHPQFSSDEPAFSYLSTIEDCHIRYSGGDCSPGAIDLEMGSDSIGDYVAMRYSTTDSVNRLVLEYACLQRSIGHSIIGSFDIGQSYSEVCARLEIDANSLQILRGKSVKPRKRTLYSRIDQVLTIDNTLEADDYFLHWTTSSIELPIQIDTATATYAYTLTLWLEEGKVQVLTLRRQR